MEKRDSIIPENVVEVIMIMIGLVEIVHISALYFKLSLTFCTYAIAVMAIMTFLVFTVIITLKIQKRKENKREHRFLKLYSVYPILFSVVGLLIIIQIVWNYWAHIPYLNGDITVETVKTLLSSDRLYEINPMTGIPFTQGMPSRLKILVLPTLFASICKMTGISAELLCFSIYPSLVLILSYYVYSRWALFLFPLEGKKQAIFMLFVVAVAQFGCYSAAMDSFLLFFKGYQGIALRAGVILPYALLCCLKGKWKKVILCIIAEACVVWTLYGMGYTVIIAIVVLVTKGIRFLVSRRKKA